MSWLLNNIMMPGRRSYTTSDLPSPPLVFVSAVPCLKVGKGDRLAVYFHGNGEDLGSVWRFAVTLAERLDCTLYVPEYRGYGIHRGPVSPDHTVSDGVRVLHAIARHHACSVHVLGYSIGTAVASAVVGRCFPNTIASLALIAPLHSAHAMVLLYVNNNVIADLVAKDHVFNSVKWLKKYDKPVFVVHGKEDTIVPYINSVWLKRDLGAHRIVLHSIDSAGHSIDWNTSLLDNIDMWWKYNS